MRIVFIFIFIFKTILLYHYCVLEFKKGSWDCESCFCDIHRRKCCLTCLGGSSNLNTFSKILNKRTNVSKKAEHLFNIFAKVFSLYQRMSNLLSDWKRIFCINTYRRLLHDSNIILGKGSPKVSCNILSSNFTYLFL